MAKQGEIPNRLGWPLTTAALIAMATLLLTSGQNLELSLMGVALVVSQFVDVRLPRARSTTRALRVFIFTWLILVIGWPQDSIRQWYVKPIYTNLVGCILAAEIVIRAWEQRDPKDIRRFRHVELFFIAMLFATASNTVDARFIQLLTPVFIVALLACLWQLTGPKAMKTSTAAISVFSIVIGFIVVRTIASVDRELQLWALNYFKLSTTRRSIGLNSAPYLGPVFNPEPSMERVLVIDGPVGERHWRILSFDACHDNQWFPTVRQRVFQPVSSQSLHRGTDGPKFDVRIVGDTFDLLPTPLNTAAIECNADLDREQAGTFRFTDGASEHRYQTIVSKIENFQGPASLQLEDAQRAQHLEIPATLRPQVIALARQAAGNGDPMSRVSRLILHLQAHHQYSLSFQPGPGDVLSDFILNDRAAHCEYFASALVVMARAAGVPSRLATGYYVHETAGSSRMIVRDRDAHAWAECWIDGVGWITADATPSSGLPEALYAPPSRLRQFWETIQDIPTTLRDWLANVSRETIFMIILICAGGVLILAIVQRLRRRARSDAIEYAQPPEHLIVVRDRFERWLKGQIPPCASNQTWRGHARALPQPSRCLDFIDIYEQSRFGGADGQLVPRLIGMLEELERK